MLSSGQIKKKFGLKKSQVDFLAARFGREWALKKDGGGRYLWDDESQARLKTHLKLDQANAEQSAERLPTLPMQAPNAEQEQNTLILARAIGEKLDSFKADFKIALATQAENYQKEISELKRELVRIKNSLPPTHGDRRHEPTSFWDLCYRYFCLAPVVERRR